MIDGLAVDSIGFIQMVPAVCILAKGVVTSTILHVVTRSPL